MDAKQMNKIKIIKQDFIHTPKGSPVLIGKNVGLTTPKGKEIDGIIHKTPGGLARDANDQRKHRHNRDRYNGFQIGYYIQTPPLIFTRDGHAIYMGDTYRGSSAFLICGGPSFSKLDSSKLKQPGILTMGVNNAVKSFRTNLWTEVDDPTHFIRSIWLDPTITKFVPYDHAEKRIFDSDAWKELDILVGDCPNVWYFRRNENFIPEQFLFEDTINWGNHSSNGGGRSVMLVALRLLFFLGVRKVYLLGVDFKMNEESKYHFEQNRSKGSISGNNSTYEQLIRRFELLKPIFDKHGFQIFNCNFESKLRVFPFIDYEEAIKEALSDMPADLKNERTEGLYDRISNIKDRTKVLEKIRDELKKTQNPEEIKRKKELLKEKEEELAKIVKFGRL